MFLLKLSTFIKQKIFYLGIKKDFAQGEVKGMIPTTQLNLENGSLAVSYHPKNFWSWNFSQHLVRHFLFQRVLNNIPTCSKQKFQKRRVKKKVATKSLIILHFSVTLISKWNSWQANIKNTNWVLGGLHRYCPDAISLPYPLGFLSADSH